MVEEEEAKMVENSQLPTVSLVTTKDEKVTSIRNGSMHNNCVNGRAAAEASPLNGTILFGEDDQESSKVGGWHWLTMFALVFTNLLNYMDRLTIAAILNQIQVAFGDPATGRPLGDDEAGLLQTGFIVSYTVFAPLFGYLGDRHNRRRIMVVSVAAWGLATLLGSFVPESPGNYWWFLALRLVVGAGQASFSTISPTVIGDMFANETRSKMLALFYFAIPVGSGLGYIVASAAANLGESWRWGFRVTPVLALASVVLLAFFSTEPRRGASDGAAATLKASSWRKDVSALCRNPTFVLSTLAFTCVSFCTGAVSFWGPKYFQFGVRYGVESGGSPAEHPAGDRVSLYLGLVLMLSGMFGVPVGALLSAKLKSRFPRVDPIICGTGILVSCPVLYLSLSLCHVSGWLCLALIFLGMVALNLNWSLVSDMVLYVVIPTRRSSAEALQIFCSHALGDAGSPYLIGLISEALKARSHVPVGEWTAGDCAVASQASAGATNGTAGDCFQQLEVEFYSLQYALFVNNAVEFLGGIFFLLSAIYIVADKQKCDKIIRMDCEKNDKSDNALLE